MAFNFTWGKKKRQAPKGTPPTLGQKKKYPMPKMPKGQDMGKMRSNLRNNISNGRGVGY